MSHVALRRVAIRLLHDPTLVARLHMDPERALHGVALDGAERAWLLAVPPAAWRTDPERPARVLAALRDEFPVSLALAPSAADGFFQSERFHRAVQERGSLASAFGAHLARGADARVVAVARLECAIAGVRRAPRTPAPSPAGMARLAPTARVLRVAHGAAEAITAWRIGRTTEGWDTSEECILVHRQPGRADVSLEPLEDGSGDPARRCKHARPRRPAAEPSLRARCRARGGPQRHPGFGSRRHPHLTRRGGPRQPAPKLAKNQAHRIADDPPVPARRRSGKPQIREGFPPMTRCEPL